jgi:hypothetical protein
MDRQHIEELVMAAYWKLRGNKTFIQGTGLIERLAKEAKLDALAVQGALSGLERSGILAGICNGIPMGKVTALVEKPTEAPHLSYLLWKDSLACSGLTEEEQNTLLPLYEIVSDMEQSDHTLLIKSLVKLRTDQEVIHGRPSFMVSSEYLLGSSKILDALPSKVLRQFGIDKARFTGAPPVLLVAGPLNPENVVLVENPHAFWNAIRSGATTSTVFIVTFGYGLSRHGEDYGNQLVSILESGSVITAAICAGNPPPLSNLLHYQNISFWGDLDIEGLKIYQRIKKFIPQLTLSALYTPMVEAVSDPAKSHPYVKAAAKHKQSISDFHSACDELTTLFNYCLDRAVDQEAVKTQDIIRYSRLPLPRGKEQPCDQI